LFSTDPTLLTPAARRHIARMARAIAPSAARLERQFRASLVRRGLDRDRTGAFLAITPAAAARLGSVAAFLKQVEDNGRRLAKLNVGSAEVRDVLREFGTIADESLDGRFAPSREQLHLATILVLQQAFYRVREAETQAFFGLERAEAEAGGLEDMQRRFARVLARAFGARTARLLLLPRPAAGGLARPFAIARGGYGQRLLARGMKEGCRSWWSLPLSAVAVVQLGFREPRRWLPRELALVEAAAQRCRDAGERGRLEREIRRLEAEARRAEEEERRRIGRELHDEAGQSLLALRLELERIERAAPAGLARRLRAARAIAERTVADLRRIIAALSPAVLERLGLEAALRHLAARFQKVHPAEVRLRLADVAGTTQDVRQVIYRVTQEALQNVARHSGASRVNLSLREADKHIRLRVSDNGAGFSTEAAGARPMSFGLAGMRERAELLGGRLVVRSAPGRGVAITLDLPLGSAPVASHGKNTGTVD
jgi:signal transduction histidine kinase